VDGDGGGEETFYCVDGVLEIFCMVGRGGGGNDIVYSIYKNYALSLNFVRFFFLCVLLENDGPVLLRLG
jgi:hypothetical protein